MSDHLFGISVIKILVLLIVAVLGLSACQNDDTSIEALAEALPLDQQKSTFVFFYTDG